MEGNVEAPFSISVPLPWGIIPTGEVTLKGFTASFFGSPIDQFGIGEVEVDGTEVITTPTTKDQCKSGGWRNYERADGSFKNEGDCIQFVNGGK